MKPVNLEQIGVLDSNPVNFNEFSKLGLLSELVRGLSEQGFTVSSHLNIFLPTA